MDNLRLTEEQLASALYLLRKKRLPTFSYLAPRLVGIFSNNKPNKFELCDCCNSIKHEQNMYSHCCTLKHCKNLIKKLGINSEFAKVTETAFKKKVIARLSNSYYSVPHIHSRKNPNDYLPRHEKRKNKDARA